MNIIKLQDMLRGVPDQALINYVQNPQGEVPSYLALSELQRRKDTRAKYQEQQAPESSVAEDLEQETMSDQGGLAMLAKNPDLSPGAPDSQGVASLPVDEDMYQEDSFAAGGIVAFAGNTDGSYVNPSLYGDRVQEYIPWYQRMKLFGQNYDLFGTGVAGPRPEEDVLRAYSKNKSYNPFISGMPRTDLAEEYGILRNKAAENKATQKDYDRMKEINDSMKAMENYRVGGGQDKDSIKAMQAEEKKKELEDAKNKPYVPLTDKEKEALKKQFGYDESKDTSKGASKGSATTQQSTDSYEDALRKRMALYKEFMGDDTDRKALKDKIDAMEKRAARQEELAPWMALTEAGFKTMQGTSPYALANIGAGAEVGIKSYGAAQDKLAALEEKRYALMNEAVKADRAERQAAITFGENSYQHQAALDQKERLGQAELDLRREANRLTKEFNTARLGALTTGKTTKAMAELIQKTNAPLDKQIANLLMGKDQSDKVKKLIKIYEDQKIANEKEVRRLFADNGLAGVQTSATNADPLGILSQ